MPPHAGSHRPRWRWLDGSLPSPDILVQTARTSEPQWYETYAEFVAAVPGANQALTPPERLQAVVVLPLRIGRRTLGVISFSFSEARQFGPEQRDFLLTISEVCAQALDRAHLFEAERSARTEAAEANRRLQMLSEATKAFAESNRDFSSALGVIAQSLTEMVGDSATIALISLIKGDGTVMENVAARARDPEFAEELKAFAREHPQRLGQGLRGRVAATGEAVFIPVVDKEQLREEIEPDYKPIFNRFKLSSIIVVPLRAHERILGTISLSRADPRRPLTAADLAVVQELADRAALTIENARLYESSQRAIRVRDHMLALAAHELATPLTVLRLQLSSLQRSELGAERSASKLEMATRCLERLDNVIDKFLDISCISAGQLALTPEPVDLAAMVRDVCELFSERLARSECELDLHADQSVVGRWDKLRLEQVVTNLLSNACKFGRGKPIEVSVGLMATWRLSRCATTELEFRPTNRRGSSNAWSRRGPARSIRAAAGTLDLPRAGRGPGRQDLGRERARRRQHLHGLSALERSARRAPQLTKSPASSSARPRYTA